MLATTGAGQVALLLAEHRRGVGYPESLAS
jgi:hypothetical protein